MQLILPIFPKDCKHLSRTVMVQERDNTVYYFANGLPVFSHGYSEINSFRYITCNLIEQGLCKITEVSKCFGIPENSISHQLRIYRKNGAIAFFSRDIHDKKSHKLHGELLLRVQRGLDKGLSNNQVAKKEGISEGTIRYGLSKGTLKKKPD